METRLHTHLTMVGPALDSRSGIASLVGAWREQGLFRRWPVDYIATRADATPAQNAKVLANGLRAFAENLARHGRVALHVHVKPQGLWREAPFAAIAAAARCPLVLQLHGGGFENFYDRASMPVRAALRLALGRAACVVAPSESLRAWTRTIAREAHAIWLPPAVPLQPSAGGEKQNLVLFLGRLEAAKGIFDLLEALAVVRASIPDLRLVCAKATARWWRASPRASGSPTR
jgi:glycosyltransferase involved in cell wall biosynthesis